MENITLIGRISIYPLIFGLILSYANADDIYLTTGFIVKNVQALDTVEVSGVKYLRINSKQRERRIPLLNVQKIIFNYYDSTIDSRTIDVVDSSKHETVKQDKSEEVTDNHNNVTNNSIVMVKTYSGDTITGELITTNDSSVTYKTNYGLVILQKNNILSVNKGKGISASNIDNNLALPIYLNEQQKQEFARRRLSIELEGVGLGSSGGSSFFNSSLYLTQYQTWRNWKASEGFTKISEEDFFIKTGYKKEAVLAREYYGKQKVSMTWGILFGIFGAALNYVGWTSKETVDVSGYKIESPKPNYILIIGGSVSSIIGVTLYYSGSVGMRTNWSQYSTVQGIAEEYNNKLENEVRNKK